MTIPGWFYIVYKSTGKRVDQCVYPGLQVAHDQITEWQNRHDRGGRPDITREMLLDMTVREMTP